MENPAIAESAPLAEPVQQRDRISAVDTLRGFALLGILAMNITSFALHEGFDYRPVMLGDAGKWNLFLWAARYVVFDGKMRALFSMLFGAGVILLTSRLEKRGEAGRSADIFLRRNLWLLAIGLIHGFFLWWGDILYTYALTGLLFLYPCRKLSPRKLIGTGLAVLAIGSIYFGFRYERRKDLEQRALVAKAMESAGKQLTDDQKDDLKALQRSHQRWQPDQAELDKDNAEMRSGYLTVMKRNAATTMDLQSTGYYRWGFCDALSMMLIGMGLMSAGFLSAQLPWRVYVWTAVIGYGIGLPLGVLSTWEAWHHGFDIIAMMKWEFLPYDIQRLATALGHASAVLMIVKAGALRWITRPLAAVGQTALSNYLGTTIICILIFDGFGLGMFGKLQLSQLLCIVAGIWSINLVVSSIWLKYFRFGPIEWAWRSLTYWRAQPMRRVEVETGSGALPVEA
jgi:uncharacterized protein